MNKKLVKVSMFSIGVIIGDVIYYYFTGNSSTQSVGCILGCIAGAYLL